MNKTQLIQAINRMLGLCDLDMLRTVYAFLVQFTGNQL